MPNEYRAAWAGTCSGVPVPCKSNKTNKSAGTPEHQKTCSVFQRYIHSKVVLCDPDAFDVAVLRAGTLGGWVLLHFKTGFAC